MTTPIACPKCGADFGLAESISGKQICPRCEHTFLLGDDEDVANVLAAEPGEEIGEVLAVDEPSPSRSRFRKEEPDDAMIWWVAYRNTALTFRKGVAVLRPGYVAFVPTAKQVNLLGSFAGQVAMSATHVHVIPLTWFQKKQNVPEIVQGLWEEYREEFDDYLRDFVGESGGEVWTREECKVTHVPSRRPTGKHGVTFQKDKVELQGAAKNGPALGRLLDGWQKAPQPMGNTAVRCFVISVIPAVLTVIALIFYFTGSAPLAAPIVWAGFTALFWVLGLVAVIRKSRQKVVGQDSQS